MFRKTVNKLKRRLGPRPVDQRFLQSAGGAVFTLPELTRRARPHNEEIIRSLCFCAYLGEDTALCRVLGRYKMFVDTQDRGVSPHLIVDGFWEIWHTEAMLEFLKPGMKAVDIGANLGYFTMIMSELVGANGSVHAFEPNPAVAARLRDSVAINGFAQRTIVHELALADRAGESLLAIPEHGPGGGHVIADVRGRTGTPITLERFDALPALSDADYIKIDVEGFEDAVWRGMRGLLDTARPLTIVMEFTADRYADAAGFVDQIVADGFSLALLDNDDGIVPIDCESLLAKPGDEEQLILLRR